MFEADVPVLLSGKCPYHMTRYGALLVPPCWDVPCSRLVSVGRNGFWPFCRPASGPAPAASLCHTSPPFPPNLAARADDLQLPSSGATRCSQQVPLLLPLRAAPLNHVPCSGFCPHCPGNRCPGCLGRSQPLGERPEQRCSLSVWGRVVTVGPSLPLLTWTPLLRGLAGLRTWNTFMIN